MNIDKDELDRYITGNYGEDQIRDEEATPAHTPGYWFVGYDPDGDELDGPNGDYVFNGTVYAATPAAPLDEPIIVAEGISNEADARLFAAAPSLLAVLTDVIAWRDGERALDWQTVEHAIAQATGQPT